MAKIKINNMMLYGFHGIYEYEREQGQKFYIDVEMETANDDACGSDNLDDAVDSARVYYLVKEKGLKLDAAQEQIRHNRSNVDKRFEVVERLRSIRGELVDILEAMNKLQ